MHFIEIDGHGSNKGHGHQNEAAFYILEGAGYEIHDDLRYDWKKDDFVFVHTDSVHRHFNPYDEKAKCLVVKAKCTWMFLGLLQQGRGGPIDREAEFGPREDWSAIWTPGVLDRTKKISPEDTVWEDTDLGRIRVMTSPQTDHARLFSVDAFEFEIEPGGHTGKHWKMADEVLYALDGDGYSLHWEVQAEIAERYYAHIALEPKRYDFKKGDTLYVPQNTVAQHFAADGTPVRLLSFQNRLFKHLGYDNVKVLEPRRSSPAPATPAAARTAGSTPPPISRSPRSTTDLHDGGRSRTDRPPRLPSAPPPASTLTDERGTRVPMAEQRTGAVERPVGVSPGRPRTAATWSWTCSAPSAPGTCR